MTDKTEGLEVVMTYEGRCIIDCGDNGHHHVTMHKMIAAGSELVTFTSAQGAVAAERKLWEEATLAIKAIGDANADSDCARITALETALGVAREALEEATNYTACTAWSPSMTEECAEAIALIDTTLGAKP